MSALGVKRTSAFCTKSRALGAALVREDGQRDNQKEFKRSEPVAEPACDRPEQFACSPAAECQQSTEPEQSRRLSATDDRARQQHYAVNDRPRRRKYAIATTENPSNR